MREHEVKSGESYLFANTDVEHRKNMVGTIVTVCGVLKGKDKTHYQHDNGKKPNRFKLTNGQYANAGNLKPITQQ